MQAEAQAAAPRPVAAATKPAEDGKAAVPAKVKRKRRFPYRKVEDLEADIAREETRLRETEQRLASPDLYRDGERVKAATREFEEIKQRLQHLYEHWEEAVELS